MQFNKMGRSSMTQAEVAELEAAAARARLAAAAPDLLAALEALREADTPEEVQAAREQADAAIAKAQSA